MYTSLTTHTYIVWSADTIADSFAEFYEEVNFHGVVVHAEGVSTFIASVESFHHQGKYVLGVCVRGIGE